MNILFADQFSEPGGAQLCLLDLLPEIQRRGWTARLMAPGNGMLLKEAAALGNPVEPLHLGPYSSGRKSASDLLRFVADIARLKRSLRRAVKDHRIDVLYVNGPRIMPATQGLDIPVVFHAHSVVGGIARLPLDRALRASQATVIAASAFVARRLPGALVVYNGVPDLDGPRTQVQGPVRIGIVGRIAPEKGHLDFMRAASAVNGATFHVFGESLFSDPAYAAQVRALAPEGRTEFAGWADDIGAALRRLDILAVPSGPQEAATRVIMEAFSAGTAVVAYRAGGIPELVTHERTGLLVEPGPESLAAGIRRLASDPELRRSLAQAGREEWRARFTRDAFRAAVCQVIAAVGSPSTKPSRQP